MFEFFFKYPATVFSRGQFVFLAPWPVWLLAVAVLMAGGALAWHVPLDDYLTDATPALERRVIFVSVHSSSLEALNAYTGQVYWAFETHEKIQAPPMVSGKRVLLASRTTVWALEATNGQLVWKFHRGVSAWPSSGSPTLLGDTVYIGLGTGTQFWALDLANGHIRWSFDTNDRITSTALAEAGRLRDCGA